MDIIETVNVLFNLFVFLEFLLLFPTSIAFAFDIFAQCIGRTNFDERNIHFLEVSLKIYKIALPWFTLYILIFKNIIDSLMIYVFLIVMFLNMILTFYHLKLITRN